MWVAAVRRIVLAEVTRRTARAASGWPLGAPGPVGYGRPFGQAGPAPAAYGGAPSAGPRAGEVLALAGPPGRRVQDAFAAWRDPARRFARRKRRARRSLGGRSLATVGLAWVTSVVGAAPGIELGEVFWGSVTAAAAVTTVAAARRVWRLEHTAPPPPALPRPGPLPPRDSVARPAMERLVERERVLGELVGHLGPAAEETRWVAADAGSTLRAHAARITAVDRARRCGPAGPRAGLDAALAVLLRQLDDGVAAYDALVVAAAGAVSASATLHAADPVLTARLQDATDALAGLAQGMREISALG